MLLTEGPLTWPVADGVCTPVELSDDLAALAEATAIEWLWGLSGRQFGTREAVYRPQARCLGGFPPSWLQPLGGAVFGWSAGWPYGRGGEPYVPASLIELPGQAVSVTSVTVTDIEGVTTTVDPSLYRLDGNWLVRQDGNDWPTTQNLIVAAGQPNTWSVSYVRGTPVPVFGTVAAALLVCEFSKRFANDPKIKCAIPFNAVTVSRGGITINRNVLKATSTTGVAEADQWIAQVNPNGLAQDSVIWSPDLPRNSTPYAGSQLLP